MPAAATRCRSSCRVTGGDGKLVGYSGSGGIETKRLLLQLEGALLI
jgi:O6-methylguanine-DNA--protein-cysteine methyltransferase